MQLLNEITVDADVERTWTTLLDIARVASCLPGAQLEPAGEDDVFKGAMRIKIGPITTQYQGTARLRSADEKARVTEIEVEGKEAKGQGAASATISTSLTDEGPRTKIAVATDLTVTGRQAQFGRGIMQDIAERMLNDFAGRLEREILAPAATAGAAGDGAEPPAATPAGERLEAFDAGGMIAGPLAKRAAPIVGAGLLVVLLVLLRRRRRDDSGLQISWRAK